MLDSGPRRRAAGKLYKTRQAPQRFHYKRKRPTCGAFSIPDQRVLKQTLFLEAPNSSSANFNFNLFTFNHQSFGLQIRLPHFTGMALGKADIAAVLLTLVVEI